MGHTWLRGVPLSAKWLRVFEQLVGGAGLAADDVAELAALTADAASTALRKAADDAGLRHAFYILALTSKAADETGLRGNLSRVGIDLPDRPCLFDLTVEIQAAIDDHIFRHGHPTDISEIAQQAVGEAVLEMVGGRTSVFDSGSAGVASSLESIASQTGFGRLGQLFFGRFAARFLNFYLSRITAEYVGSARIPSVPELSRLNDELRLHCENSAVVVLDVCERWYAATPRAQDASPETTARLLSEALDKLERQLMHEADDR